MWEAYGLENEDLLWASTALNGGIGGYRYASCGAVASSAICLGFRNRCSLNSREAVEQARNITREKARRLAESFYKKFGNISCQELTDYGPLEAGPPDPETRARNREDYCIHYVQFCIEKLYELDKS
jgi:C_GCAxxG_C_C family probable redox protein